MQLVTFLSTAALVATASARSAVSLNGQAPNGKGRAHIINRCNYDLNLWSVYRGDGCPEGEMVTLKKGEQYSENFELPKGGVGVSIKISKTKQCKGNDITQFEYYYETEKDKDGQNYNGNYIDVSYVDCLGGDCPTMKEGYYLVAGDQSNVATAASAGNTRNPILSCHDPASCAKISYILPDDVQTKYCTLGQDVYYYMCGGNAPSANDDKPYSSLKPVEPPVKPTPTPSKEPENYKVNAAAVTPKPEIIEPIHTPKVKTEMVYVTEYKYVNVKRHAHGHARRHQNFHA